MDIIFFLILCLYSGGALSGDRISMSLNDYRSNDSGALVRITSDLELIDEYGVRAGFLVVGTGGLMRQDSRMEVSGSSSGLMAGLSLEGDSNKFVAVGSDDGFIVGHEVSKSSSFLKKTFIGLGVINNDNLRVPMSAYADIGTSISLFGFKIETKYRFSNGFNYSNGFGFAGEYSYEPWLTITMPF